MKNLLLFIFAVVSCCFILGSCCSNRLPTQTIQKDTIVIVHTDTLYKEDKIKIDSLVKCLKQAQDSICFYRDSIKYNDYINARRIQKVKYYLNICEKKPSNKKFFYGWIKRTMTE